MASPHNRRLPVPEKEPAPLLRRMRPEQRLARRDLRTASLRITAERKHSSLEDPERPRTVGITQQLVAFRPSVREFYPITLRLENPLQPGLHRSVTFDHKDSLQRQQLWIFH